jgi:hypothetical protein
MYLGEQALVLEKGHVLVGMMFSKMRGRQSELVLEIESGDMKIEEGQREAFIKLIGNRGENYFKKYWEKRAAGEVFDITSSRELLKETGI